MTDQAQPQEDAPKISKPGIWLLIFGVIYSAAVTEFELVTRMCAEALFDPMPTPLHVVLVAAAPLVNLALWLVLRRDKAPSRWWALAGGAASAIALCYALVFLPLYPLAVVAVVIYGLG